MKPLSAFQDMPRTSAAVVTVPRKNSSQAHGSYLQFSRYTAGVGRLVEHAGWVGLLSDGLAGAVLAARHEVKRMPGRHHMMCGTRFCRSLYLSLDLSIHKMPGTP